MLEKEYDYYKRNKKELVKKYKNRFIVIKDEKIIGDYEDRAKALKETVKNHKLGTFLIQEVIESDSDHIQRFFSRVYVKT